MFDWLKKLLFDQDGKRAAAKDQSERRGFVTITCKEAGHKKVPALWEELHLPVRCETLAQILPGMSGKEGQKRPEKPVCEDSRIV